MANPTDYDDDPFVSDSYLRYNNPPDLTAETVGGPPWWSEDDRKRVAAWFNSTNMCVTCCRRVPKTEIDAGLHAHPAVMD